jgi:hypothetical protein
MPQMVGFSVAPRGNQYLSMQTIASTAQGWISADQNRQKALPRGRISKW